MVAKDADRSSYNSLLAYRIADVQDKFTIDSQSGQIVLAYGASLGNSLNFLRFQTINPILGF